MPKVYLTRRRGRQLGQRACPICIANDPRPHGGLAFHKMGFKSADRRPRHWHYMARAYQHPNPLRANVTLWRCRKHARLQFVPLDEKRGLGGGVYH